MSKARTPRMLLTDYIAWTNRQPWRPVSGWGVAFAASFAGYFVWFTFTGDGWVPLMDSANLAVHESGHPLARAFGERAEAYGGTVAQLLLPLICMLEFWRRRWAMSYALCVLWLAQSLLNVARYLADARAMKLPLVGFSAHPLHDWNAILPRWGLLTLDTMLANGLRVFAGFVIAGALAFLVERWRDRTRTAPADDF